MGGESESVPACLSLSIGFADRSVRAPYRWAYLAMPPWKYFFYLTFASAIIYLTLFRI
jgi:hypothetical protein